MGSTFMVRLPLTAATQPLGGSARSSQPLHVGPQRLPRRVLMVDDNVDAAATLVQLLQLQGHEARAATSGIEAVQVAGTMHPDVIFMDVGMPGMDGIEAAQRIHAQPWSQRIRIVVLTGWGQESDRQRTLAAGMQEHLVKPVSPEALAESLSR